MIYPFKISQMKADNHVFWVAESTTLKGCIGQGDTQEEALSELNENEQIWLDTAKEMGYDIPSIPIEEPSSYSGKLTLRISPYEHGLAAENAQREGISLNQYINDAVVARNHEMKDCYYVSEATIAILSLFKNTLFKNQSVAKQITAESKISPFGYDTVWNVNSLN